jgi:pyruvate formate lyase activating enzyme
MSSREDAGPTGTIYDIQGFSVQDGPGIRTTVFLKGCPLRCPWCHSPESQRFDIQLSWQSRKCIGTRECGLCLTVCPRGALRPAPVPEAASDGTDRTDGMPAQGPAALVTAGDGVFAAECPVAPVDAGVRLIEVDWDRCDDCGLCAEHCPAGALSMWGKSYTVSEVVTRVLRDRPFFEKSGGGVTISGGEPFSQPRFTLALLQALKQEGLHTALDTTGFASWGVLERALPFVDLFLLDLKNMDSGLHKAVVGVHNERILDNARRLAAAGASMQIRVPVIPRFNDSGSDMRALGAFVAGLGDAVTLVQLLPYHAMGVPKWERIKHDGPVLEAAAPSDKRIAELRAILEEYDLPVQVH